MDRLTAYGLGMLIEAGPIPAVGGLAIPGRRRADRDQRVIRALVGSAVGDALGAPFEFGPAAAFSSRFPTSARGTRTEMCGGGLWEPAE
ncbi:MAG TPA: ADP-ribosylglycohydrolase family protein [Mycobacteriales bacterium]|nr:ADP-ribosylglycohydrolase family protein [Mycobacteriales bacterium]